MAVKSLTKNLNLLHFLNDGFFASLILLLPFIAEDIEISLDEVGILGGLLRGLSIILLIPIAVLSSRFGTYKLILLSVVFYSIGFLGTSFSTSFSFLLVFFTIAGIGFAPFHPLAYGLISRVYKNGKKGRVIGNLSAFGETGKLFMTFVVTTIVAFIGWKYTSFGQGIIGMAVVLGLSFLARRSLPQYFHANEAKDDNEKVNGYKQLLKEPNYLLAVASSGIDYFASGSLYIFLPFLLLDKALDPKLLGVLTGVLFIGNVLGKSQLSRLVDKFGYFPVLLISETIMAILIVLVAGLNNFYIMGIVIVVLGFFTKGTGPVLISVISDSVDHLGNFEKAFSISETINSITGTLAPLIFGFVGEALGIQYAFYMMATFALIALVPATLFRLLDKD